MRARILSLWGLSWIIVACAGSSTAPIPAQNEDSGAVTEDGGGIDSVTPAEDTVMAIDTKPPVTVDRATCEAPVGGELYLSPDTAYEAIPGYDEELEALDLAGLPASIDLSVLLSLERALVAYMLEVPQAELGESLDRDTLLAGDPMAQAVLGAFAEATRKENEGLDLPFLRRGLHRFYQCDRSFPLTLDGFKAAIFDYSDVPYYDLEVSFPKLFERRMREAHLEGVYVAETLVEGVARETEILLSKARSDGALEFLVYDEAGRLVDRGAFATAAGGEISGASPYTCIACHFEKGTFEFIVTFPSL